MILRVRVLGIWRPLLRLLVYLRRGRRIGSPAWTRLRGRLIHGGRKVRGWVNLLDAAAHVAICASDPLCR